MNSKGAPLMNRALLGMLRPSAKFPIQANDFYVTLHCNLTKESDGGHPIANRAILAMLRGGANFAISAIDCFVRIQCNLTKDFDRGPPLLNRALRPPRLRPKREIPMAAKRASRNNERNLKDSLKIYRANYAS